MLIYIILKKLHKPVPYTGSLILRTSECQNMIFMNITNKILAGNMISNTEL